MRQHVAALTQAAVNFRNLRQPADFAAIRWRNRVQVLIEFRTEQRMIGLLCNVYHLFKTWEGFIVRTYSKAVILIAGAGFILPSVAVAQSINANTLAALTTAASQVAGSYTSALGTLNGAFFNQNNAYVSSPINPQPNQIGGGGWVRATGGTFDVNANASGNALGIGSVGSSFKVFNDYSGIQAGADLGRYRINGGDVSVNFGVTGGTVGVDSRSTGPVPISAHFDMPFVGAYAAAAGYGFFGDVLYRHDFISSSVTVPAVGFNNKTDTGSDTVSASLGYHYDVMKMFFVEPSVGFSYSNYGAERITLPSTVAGTVATFNGVPLTFVQKSTDSDLGRLTLRVGKDFVVNGILLEPFAVANVFNEFAGRSNATLIAGSDANVVASETVSRIGTFGQFSLGLNARLTSANLLAFVRGDVRTGDDVHGQAINGGVRYQF